MHDLEPIPRTHAQLRAYSRVSCTIQSLLEAIENGLVVELGLSTLADYFWFSFQLELDHLAHLPLLKRELHVIWCALPLARVLVNGMCHKCNGQF